MVLTTQDKCLHACPPDTCDMFQFMAKEIGLKVLHPGGFTATREMARRCRIERGKTILDVGCGSGSSAIYLAKKFGCQVIGVDIDEQLLRNGKKRAQKEGVEEAVRFRFSDIHDLPFDNGVFDGAVAQAVLIFTDKTLVFKELARVVKPGGFIGAVELAWKQAPTDYVISRVRNILCSASINAELHREWVKLFKEAGIEVDYSDLRELRFNFRDLVRDEGLLSGLAISFKTLLKASIREKIRDISGLFKETQKYLGYGLYIGKVV